MKAKYGMLGVSLVFGVSGIAQDFGENALYDLGRIQKVSATNNAVTTSVTSKDIADMGANDVAEALRQSVGVMVQDAGNSRGEPSIGIRGYSQTHIGLFIDGVPVHSIYDRQTDWAQFSTYGISEIQVNKGFTSPIYGINTLGGAVNIITSKPQEKLEIDAKTTLVTQNEKQLQASIGTNQEKYYFQTSFSYVDRDSYDLSGKFEPTLYQPTKEKIGSNYSNKTWRGKIGFVPNESHEYSLNFIYQEGSKGGMLDANTGGRVWQWPKYDKKTFYLLGKSQFTQNLSLESRLYYDTFYNELNMLGRYNADGSIGGGFTGNSIYDDYSYGLIETLSYQMGEATLSGGVNLHLDRHESRDSTLAGVPSGDDTLEDFTHSYFAQYDRNIGEKFSFSLNGSYEKNQIRKVKLYESSINDYDTQKGENFDGWTLQGIGYYQINDALMAHVNVGRKEKLLTLKDRYSEPWGQRTRNPNLTPEAAINYEAGLSFEKESTNFSIVGFYNDLTDMLIAVADSTNSCANGVACTKLVNADEGYSYGAEVALTQGFFQDKLNLGANYTYVKKKVTNEDSTNYVVDGSRILDYPEHTFNVSAKIKPTSTLAFNIFGRFNSDSYTTNDISTEYIRKGSVFVMDTKIDLKLRKDVLLSFGVYNLLDRNYYTGSGYYMPGRRFFASMEYKF